MLIRYGDTALNWGLQSSGGGRQGIEIYEKRDGSLWTGFFGKASVFKEEFKLTKQKSGSEFLAEGTRLAKTITLKGHGLTGGWREV